MRTISLFFILSSLFFVTACKEDPIEPSGNYSVLRLTFPQGDSDYDKELKEIHDTYDTYVLYRGITLPDLNREWTSVGTGGTYYGDDVPEKYRRFYVDFIKRHVLDNVSVEIAKNALPVKVYLLHNLRCIPSGEPDKPYDPEEYAKDPETAVSPYFQSNRLDGFDYWAISFRPKEIADNDRQALRMRRCALVYQFILKAWKQGKIVQPEGMMDGLDLETAFSYDHQNPEMNTGSKNHPWKRGFVWYIYPEFDPDLNRGQFENTSTYISYYDGNGRTKLDREDNVYFLNYVRAAMYYTRTEFFAKYSETKFPIIKEKYELVVKYMKEKYAIDLEGIANGPADKE